MDNRLIAFGCSNTYGQFLPETKANNEPSKYSWPSLLAPKLNRVCYNEARLGAGNLNILHKILRYNFQPNDLVIIGYSFFDRYFMHEYTDNDGHFNELKKFDKNYEVFVKGELVCPHLDARYYWLNWYTIHHAECYLNSLGISNYSFNNAPTYEKIPMPVNIKLNNFWYDFITKYVDRAADDLHPGPETHRLLSEQIYNKLSELAVK